MKIIHTNIEKEAQILFELDNLALHRDFDLPSRDIQEQQDYLKGSDVYIIYDDNKVMGFFAFKKEKNDYELLAVVVRPEQQGKGYGKAMTKKLLELTKGSVVRLVTHPKNASAIVYYLKSGFEIYGWKDNYYGDGKPRLLLKRS